MKRVIVALKNSIHMFCLLPMIERLKESGISTEAYLWDEELPVQEEFLYITDCQKVAEDRKAHKLPLLGFSHAEGDELPAADYIMEEPEDIDVEYLMRIYQRHRGLPWQILETERCIIRESTVEDVDIFYEIYEDESIVKYMEALCVERDREKAYMKQYIDKIYKYFEYGIWTVLHKETGEIIGRAGFAVRDGYDLPDLGFLIAGKWQQKGIAYEICNALLTLAKSVYEFDKVQALVMPENIPSRNLCRKLGFQEKGAVTEKGKEYLYLVKNISKNETDMA